ncbi:hypothetical protein CRG98_021721 [Punica granatum]|uniref:Uncharacterized protein n=1 Tax=Punica granatum TaxID=22663 RepID=A0A2I0JNN0_PUNGR|nr:hypothetical protein CRG98_021721 [Punica granatum]
MARLAEVTGGNGTSRNPVAPESSCSRCFCGLLEQGYRKIGWFSDGFDRLQPWGEAKRTYEVENMWNMKFGCEWLKLGWAVIGKSGGFPTVLTGFSLGEKLNGVGRCWRLRGFQREVGLRESGIEVVIKRGKLGRVEPPELERRAAATTVEPWLRG